MAVILHVKLRSIGNAVITTPIFLEAFAFPPVETDTNYLPKPVTTETYTAMTDAARPVQLRQAIHAASLLT